VTSGSNSGNGAQSSGGYSPNYSGGDMTRPENYFEIRFYETTSGTTTRTNAWAGALIPNLHPGAEGPERWQILNSITDGLSRRRETTVFGAPTACPL
jgi:hypothetical protein